MEFESQIIIANLSAKTLSSELGWIDERVDRASVLGNPFEIPDNCPSELLFVTRENVVAGFKRWLWENIKLAQVSPRRRVDLQVSLYKGLMISKKFKNPTSGQVFRELKRLQGLLRSEKRIRLLCWCYPLTCHANVIKSCLCKLTFD